MVAFSMCASCNESPPNHCKGKHDRKPDGGRNGGFRCACSCNNPPREEPK